MSLVADPELEAFHALSSHAEHAETESGLACELFRMHADFVWRVLQRLGVAPSDLEDLLQEVFVVAHKRAASFDGSSRATTWLYGIALRVTAGYRRRARARREDLREPPPEVAAADNPEEDVARGEARATLARILDRVDLDKRAVLVMFELEALSTEQIASELGIPVGTVHSRLHHARKQFRRALAHEQLRWNAEGSR